MLFDTWASSKPELQTYGSRNPSGTRKDFIHQQHSILPHSSPNEICCIIKNKHTPTFRNYISVPYSSAQQSHSPAWPLSKGPIFCAETSVHNHHSKLRKIPYERTSCSLFYFHCPKYDKYRIYNDKVTGFHSGSFPTTLISDNWCSLSKYSCTDASNKLANSDWFWMSLKLF
jgi:hypothetical protein